MASQAYNSGAAAIARAREARRTSRFCTMHVGICRITLRLPENHSLKGKRQVVKSLAARLQNSLNIAVAEVENQEAWQIAVLGVCCVSTTAVHAEQQLAAAVRYIEETRPDLELLDAETEVITAL